MCHETGEIFLHVVELYLFGNGMTITYDDEGLRRRDQIFRAIISMKTKTPAVHSITSNITEFISIPLEQRFPNWWVASRFVVLSCNWRFGGTYRLHLQGRRNNFSKNQQVSKWQFHLQLSRLHGVTSQKMILLKKRVTHNPQRLDVWGRTGLTSSTLADSPD
jgi:hypothetical protein